MSEHALLSPSSAARRVRCLGSLAACKGVPNPTNEYAANGTVHHELAARVLVHKPIAGARIYVGTPFKLDGFTITPDTESCDHVQTYVDAIRRIPGSLLVEVKLDTSPVVGVPNQSGTGDAVILNHDIRQIEVHDLKFGFGRVMADGNEQLLEYGAAAMLQFDMLGPWDTVKVAIHQPRIDHYDEKIYTCDEILAFIARIRPLEQRAYELHERGTPEEIRAALTPDPKACEWCPIRSSCPARSQKIMSLFPVAGQGHGMSATVDMLTSSEAELAALLDRVDEITGWCSDIRAEALRRALAGRELPGWKLVQGRKGARKWSATDQPTVETSLFAALGDKAYEPRSVISAPTAEKLLKKTDPALWAGLQQFIVQSEGAQVLERADDPRPAILVAPVQFPIAPEQQ